MPLRPPSAIQNHCIEDRPRHDQQVPVEAVFQTVLFRRNSNLRPVSSMFIDGVSIPFVKRWVWLFVLTINIRESAIVAFLTPYFAMHRSVSCAKRWIKVFDKLLRKICQKCVKVRVNSRGTCCGKELLIQIMRSRTMMSRTSKAPNKNSGFTVSTGCTCCNQFT